MSDVPEDLAAFCAAQRPRLVGALGLYCGDAAVAEELAQEALVRCCRDWPRVRTMVAPGAWLHRVGMNLAHSYFRRRAAEMRARRRAVTPDVVAPPEADEAMILTVRRAVTALPRRRRAVLVLRYYAGLSVADTAGALGISAAAVKSLTLRAVGDLRDELGRDVPTGEEVADVP